MNLSSTFPIALGNSAQNLVEMNQFEELREQFACSVRDFIAQQTYNESLAVEVMEHIKSLPLPEAKQLKAAGLFRLSERGHYQVPSYLANIKNAVTLYHDPSEA